MGNHSAVVALALALALALLLAPSLAMARPIQVEGGNANDARAIAWVLARRWRMQRQGWRFVDQIFHYSKPLWRGPRSPRQRKIWQQVWRAAPLTCSHVVPLSVRTMIERWGRGLEPDPCMGAVHWGVVQREHPSHLEASCDTVNTFFLGSP